MKLRVASVALVAIIGMMVTGCGTGREGQAGAEAPIAEVVDGYDCLATVDPDLSEPPADDALVAPEAGRVPAGFEPVAAYRCAYFPAPDGGVAVDVFEGEFAALLAALDLPDDAPPPNIACTADMELVPPLWLADAAGRAIHVHYPRDACAKTKPGVSEALGALTLTRTFTVGP